jgi:uncharacterized phage-like protein YoqJ
MFVDPEQSNEPRRIIISVCGHRPDKLGGWRTPNPTYLSVIEKLEEALGHYATISNTNEPTHFLLSLNLGVSQWAAEICIRKEYPFSVALPFPHFESKWPPSTQARVRWMLSRAENVYTIGEGGFSAEKLRARDEWMVHYSNLVIAAWDGSQGATAQFLAQAVAKQKPVYHIKLDPALVQTEVVKSLKVSAFVAAKPKELIEKEKEEAAAAFVRKIDIT